MPKSALLKVDLSIRTLSCLIAKLNKEVEPPEFTDHKKISPTLVACNHIVTLLTRGIEDVGKKNIGPGRRVLAVTGKLAPPPDETSFVVSVDGGEPLARAVFTQNPAPKNPNPFRVDRITASRSHLTDLTAFPYVSNTSVSQLLTCQTCDSQLQHK
jgi:hypothetical protein